MKKSTGSLLPQAPVWLGMALGLSWEMESVTPLPRDVMLWAKQEVLLTGVVTVR